MPAVHDSPEITREARRQYTTGEASFGLDPHRCALLVIDMQEEFVIPQATPYWVPAASAMVPSLAALIDRCRRQKVPVIYSVFSATHQGLDRPHSGPTMPNRYPHITPDPAWFRAGRVVEALAPRPDEVVIHKPSYGAFYDTPLQTILRNLGRDQVIISGTLTNFCCGMTARQAYERGFFVFFCDDLCATDDPTLHQAEVQVLRRGFARIVSGQTLFTNQNQESAFTTPPTT